MLLVSNFNNISKYKADVEHSVVSFISSSLGYIESTYVWNWLLLIDKTLSIYQNVELKATARDFCFSYRSFWMNSTSYEYKNLPTNKGHNLYPWEFQQTVGRPDQFWYFRCGFWIGFPTVSFCLTSDYRHTHMTHFGDVSFTLIVWILYVTLSNSGNFLCSLKKKKNQGNTIVSVVLFFFSSVWPSEPLSPKPHIRNRFSWYQMFLETRANGSRSLRVTLERPRSLIS
jgi:hypothetical protein